MNLPDGEGERRREVVNRHLAAGGTFRAAARERGWLERTTPELLRDFLRDSLGYYVPKWPFLAFPAVLAALRK